MGQIRVGTSASPRTVSPSGFCISEPILASSLLGAIPIEQVSPVSSRICFFDLSGDLLRGAFALREVQVGLVDPDILHGGAESAEHGLEERRTAHILFIIDGQIDGMGAEAVGRPERHGKMDPIFSRLVGGGGNDPAARRVPPAADDDGLTPQFGFSSFLDGREESIHVQVQDPFHTGRGIIED